MLPFLALLAVARAGPTVIMEEPGRIGVGLGATPAGTGLSAKYALTRNIALQANLLGSRTETDQGLASGTTLGADLLLSMPPIADLGVGMLGWDVGAGLALGTGRNPAEGARGYGLGMSGIAGLTLDFRKVPIDVSLEARPSFGLPPDFDWDVLGMSSHVRWWF